MFDVKPGSVPPVSIMFTPMVSHIVLTVDEALHTFGLHARITSGNEATHTGKSVPGGSEHYYNRAVDFSIKEWPEDQRPAIIGRIIAALPAGQYYIQLASDHLHIERRDVGPSFSDEK